MMFFFKDTATTEIYTLSLHDALPISRGHRASRRPRERVLQAVRAADRGGAGRLARARAGRLRLGQQPGRSEEHTSELQSQSNLVCRLLLEKKNIRQPLPSESVERAIA